MIISRSFLLRMRNFSGKNAEKIKTRILCSTTFSFSKNLAVYEIIMKNIAVPDRSQIAIRRMRVVCWIPTVINTHSEYEIFIVFLLQQLLHKSEHCLSCFFLSRFDTMRGNSLPLRGYAITLTEQATLGSSPLDEWEAHSRHVYQTTHNTNQDKSPCPRRDLNPQP